VAHGVAASSAAQAVSAEAVAHGRHATGHPTVSVPLDGAAGACACPAAQPKHSHGHQSLAVVLPAPADRRSGGGGGIAAGAAVAELAADGLRFDDSAHLAESSACCSSAGSWPSAPSAAAAAEGLS